MIRLRALLLRLADRFGRDAGLVLAARLLQNVNGFLLSVLIVRRFGLNGAGTLAVATVATVALALLGAFGLPYTLARLKIPAEEKNRLGLMAALAILPLSLAPVALLGAAFGQDREEAAVIALLALGGVFFAQTNVLAALQVLQDRARDTIIPALGNLAGLLAAALIGQNFVMFALILALTRFASVAWAYLRLPIGPLTPRDAWGHIRDSLHYLTSDALNQGSEQLVVLLSSTLMSRGELGLFGLCRQLLTVSDTPGWSQAQAVYPALVADPYGTFTELRRRMLWLGVFCGSTVAVLTVPLALFVYHLPALLIAGPVLLASVPIRYLLVVYDVQLRALGLVRRTNVLSLVRAVSAFAFIPIAAWQGGALGAVFGTIGQVVFATFLTMTAGVQKARRPLVPVG